MTNSDKTKLINQLKKTIRLLEEKQAASNEAVISEFIEKYKVAISHINSSEDTKPLRKLLNCARGYLETSSDYEQDFLYAMGETEQLIKTLT